MEALIAMARTPAKGRPRKWATYEALPWAGVEAIPVDESCAIRKRATYQTRTLSVRASPPTRGPGVRIRQTLARQLPRPYLAPFLGTAQALDTKISTLGSLPEAELGAAPRRAINGIRGGPARGLPSPACPQRAVVHEVGRGDTKPLPTGNVPLGIRATSTRRTKGTP